MKPAEAVLLGGITFLAGTAIGAVAGRSVERQRIKDETIAKLPDPLNSFLDQCVSAHHKPGGYHYAFTCQDDGTTMEDAKARAWAKCQYLAPR